MGFLWVNGFSFFHCVASPFHSFVTTYTSTLVLIMVNSGVHAIVAHKFIM